MCFSQNQVLIIYPGIIKYIGNSKLKKKFNINASSEEVYNNYTDSDSVSVSKKNILGTFPLQISWYYHTILTTLCNIKPIFKFTTDVFSNKE